MDTPKFPHHLDCQALTGITLDHLPRDGSLGRLRRYAKGTHLWQSDDAADRIYFLRRGRVAVVTATPEHRPVLLRTVEADQSFGELCLCTSRTRTRGTTASALIACDTIEIKLGQFLTYLRQNRAALEALVCTFCLRLSEAEHRVEVFAHRGADQRLGRLMLRLGSSGARDRHRRPQGHGDAVAESQRAGPDGGHEPLTCHGHVGTAPASRARAVCA